MKKLKLDLQEFKNTEVLTREQLKNVLGGSGSGSDNSCSVTCGTGYYACCCLGDCKCHGVTDTTNYGCTNGGKGSTSCSVG